MNTIKLNNSVHVIERTKRIHHRLAHAELCTGFDVRGELWVWIDHTKTAHEVLLLASDQALDMVRILADNRPMIFGADIMAHLADELRDEGYPEEADYVTTCLTYARESANVEATWDGRKYVFQLGGGHCVSYDGNDWTPAALADRVNVISLRGGPRDGERVS